MTGNSHRKRLSPTAGLPAAFLAPLGDDAEGARLLRHFRAEPTRRNRDALVRHLLPFAFAVSLAKRWHWTRALTLDEIVSDCCLGLLYAVRDFPGDDAARLRTYAAKAMRHRLHETLLGMTWGARTHVDLRAWSLRKFRADFARASGRTPTPDEVEAHVRTLVSNPLIQVGDGPQMAAASDVSPEGRRMIAARAAPTVPAADALADRELAELAMAALDDEGRKVLAMVLDGASHAEIGRAFGVAKRTMCRRINGLLWQARCAAELVPTWSIPRRCGPGARVAQPPAEPRRCDECERPFTPKARADAARFCSGHCRGVHWRRAKAAEALRACG
jgi:RNA polymerase sigma factor (sigma-70 family)